MVGLEATKPKVAETDRSPSGCFVSRLPPKYSIQSVSSLKSHVSLVNSTDDLETISLQLWHHQ